MVLYTEWQEDRSYGYGNLPAPDCDGSSGGGVPHRFPGLAAGMARMDIEWHHTTIDLGNGTNWHQPADKKKIQFHQDRDTTLDFYFSAYRIHGIDVYGDIIQR